MKDVILIFCPLFAAMLIQCVTVVLDVIVIFVKNLVSTETSARTETVEAIMSADFQQPMNSAYITLAQYSLYILAFGIWYYRAFCKRHDIIAKQEEEITFKKVVSSSISNMFSFANKSNNIIKKIIFILAILVAGISAQFFVDAILALIHPLFENAFASYDAMVERVTGASSSTLMWFTLILVSPIAEELLFRGLILHYSNRCLIPTFAILFQGFLFGVYHGNVIQGIYAFILGSLLGFMAHASKSLLPGILFHIALNFSILLVPNALLDTTIKCALTCGISLVLLVASCWFYFHKTKPSV